MMKLLWGRKDVVRECMIPRTLQREVLMELVNCAPWSEVITAGTLKVGNQEQSKTLAHSSAVVDWREIVSGHLLVLSMMVKRKVYPQDWGGGPTKSTWICENLLPGTGICCRGYGFEPFSAVNWDRTETISCNPWGDLDRTSWNESSRGTFTRMRNVVNCLKNRSSHLLWNQEVGDTCGSVKEEIGAWVQHRYSCWKRTHVSDCRKSYYGIWVWREQWPGWNQFQILQWETNFSYKKVSRQGHQNVAIFQRPKQVNCIYRILFTTWV